jgi:ankyrin repeat protein
MQFAFRRWGLSLLLLTLPASVAAAGGELSLVEAAKRQDTATIRMLMKRHADVNARQGDGATALHWASQWNDLETAKLLIGARARVNAADNDGVTPLSLACLNGSAAMAELLLKAGANPNVAQLNGDTPLIIAARTGNAQLVKILLASGANMNATEVSRGQTALMQAVAQNHTEVVRALIEKGADVHARSKGGFTAFLFATQQGNIEIARTLLSAGADVNDASPEGIGGDTTGFSRPKPDAKASALVLAIDSNREDMARFLLDSGADPNQHGAGHTALHSAVQRAMPELAKALLAHGADPNARLEAPMPLLSRYIGQQAGLDVNVVGATPFWLAADYGDADMMRILVAGGANPLLATVDKTTPVMAAAGIDFIEGQDRYGRRWFQQTTLPLQSAALEALKLAVELGGEVNAANANGQTAMHGAAYFGSNLICQFLADHGAKLNVVNKRFQTPYYITQGVYQAGSFIVRKVTGDLLQKLGADTHLGFAQAREVDRTNSSQR